MSEAIKAYYMALERLKKNKPETVPKGTAINKDTVAMEAGKKRGSIRKRPGFDQLIASIEAAGEQKTKRTVKRNVGDRINRMQAEIDALKAENNIIKGRYMSLLFLNLEMANKLKNSGIDIPKYGSVTDIKTESNLPL